MNKITCATLLLLTGLTVNLPVTAQPPAPAPCEPSSSFICDQVAPEDLLRLDENWIIASVYGGDGGVAIININNRTTRSLYPAQTPKNRHDISTYPDCPSPPTGVFESHGLYLEPGNSNVRRLFVVGHNSREAIEVFDIDTTTEIPEATWVGCAVAPGRIGLNSVRGLADGGFITTNFQNRNASPEESSALNQGEVNGELWEWHTETGWQIVPGSESSGPNGIELSEDGKTLYVAAWGSQSFFTLTRDRNNPVRREIDLGFRIDNIHWTADGKLMGVGQAGQEWKVIEIDPDSLDVEHLLSVANTREFGSGTASVEVNEELWTGSFRGNRLMVVPLP